MTAYIAEVEGRLEMLSGIDRVGTALSLAAALDNPARRGVEVFVCHLQERPGVNQRSVGPVCQIVQDVFGIVFSVRVRNDTNSARAATKLESARQTVRESLLGWCPPSAEVAIEMAASDLVKMEPNQVWWMDRYTTQHIEIAQEHT